MTYGDGVSDVDITALIAFHRSHGLDATVTAVRPPARYGVTVIEENRVTRFEEKPPGEGARINGGFFVSHPRVLRGSTATRRHSRMSHSPVLRATDSSLHFA